MDILLIKKAINGIFPPGSEIADNSLDVPPTERFWLIPGKNGPRWLIPQEKKYGLPVFQQWSPYDLASRLKWKILYAVYSAGQFGMLPGVRALGISGSSINKWQHIGWLKENKPVPIIYFGTPCKTRKLVTLLIDSSTKKLKLVAKMPLSKSSSILIKREFKILCDLQQKKVNFTPRPLFLDNKTGIAAQEAIDGRPTGRFYTFFHHEFLESLRLSSKTTSIHEKSLQLDRELTSIHITSPSLKLILNELLKKCTDTTQFYPVYVHGDFTPWNIKKIENGSIIAIDWEMGDPNGLPIYDFFYFFLIQAYLFNSNFHPNRILKFLPEYKNRYPLIQILKFTATSLGLRLAKEEQNTEYLEKFLVSIRSLN